MRERLTLGLMRRLPLAIKSTLEDSTKLVAALEGGEDIVAMAAHRFGRGHRSVKRSRSLAIACWSRYVVMQKARYHVTDPFCNEMEIIFFFKVCLCGFAPSKSSTSHAIDAYLLYLIYKKKLSLIIVAIRFVREISECSKGGKAEINLTLSTQLR